MIWLYTILSVLAVSLVSLIGIVALAVKKDKLENLLIYLVSFSVGALLGDVFIHIIPEVAEAGFDARVGLYFLLGIIVFFIAEKIIHWRHCHAGEHCEHHEVRVKPMGYTNLIGDGFHNFLDGMIIAGSFMVNPALGAATTVAVLLHEIPQEIGDFSILIYSGFTKKRAIILNLVSALLALLGAAVTLLIANRIPGLETFILGLAGGGFIYISGSDLIPELHKEFTLKNSIFQLVAIICGIMIMLALLLLE